MASGPVARPFFLFYSVLGLMLGLALPPAARLLFLVFRACCLTPLKSFAAASTRLCCDTCSSGVAAGCLHLQLGIWASGTASFF